MSPAAAWIGWIASFVFGGITLYQFVRSIIGRKVRESEEAHLEALGNSLAHIRLMCNEAIESGEIIKSDATRQFVRQIGWSVLTAEANVKAIMKAVSGEKRLPD